MDSQFDGDHSDTISDVSSTSDLGSIGDTMSTAAPESPISVGSPELPVDRVGSPDIGVDRDGSPVRKRPRTDPAPKTFRLADSKSFSVRRLGDQRRIIVTSDSLATPKSFLLPIQNLNQVCPRLFTTVPITI